MKKRTLIEGPGIPMPDYSPPQEILVAKCQSPVPEVDGRNLLYIDVNLIDPNPLQSREECTYEIILARAEDLRNQGQRDPIHVIPHPNVTGRFIIGDGWARTLACVIHRVLPQLLAEVHTGMTVMEASELGYQQNEGRTHHCELDRALYFAKLVLAGRSPTEIASFARLNMSTVSRYLAYAKLPAEILDVIRQHPSKFVLSAGYHLAMLYEKRGICKALPLAVKYEAEDQSVVWLVTQVQTLISPLERNAESPQKHISYSNGYLKQRAGNFEMIFNVPAERSNSFGAALEALLDTLAGQAQENVPELPVSQSESVPSINLSQGKKT